MTRFASSIASQFGVGVISFLVSAACIMSATGPLHAIG